MDVAVVGEAREARTVCQVATARVLLDDGYPGETVFCRGHGV